MNEYQRILVVSRMIQSARKAIQHGISLARRYESDLYVIHSIYNPFGLKGWSLGSLSIEKEYQHILHETKRQLSELVQSENVDGRPIRELLREGEPTTEILKVIEEEQIDLLVLSAHKEGLLEDLFFERSNDELVRKMPCSILLVKNEPSARQDRSDEDGPDEDEEVDVENSP